MFLFNTGICGRVNEPLTMIWGASLIILLTKSCNIPEGKVTKIYAENMMDKDYEEFSEEQLVFKGDTLYMLVY